MMLTLLALCILSTKKGQPSKSTRVTCYVLMSISFATKTLIFLTNESTFRLIIRKLLRSLMDNLKSTQLCPRVRNTVRDPRVAPTGTTTSTPGILVNGNPRDFSRDSTFVN
ncbi:uncharacterized protein LOC142349837 [Convolutriloba macropyga]|uniref:uncharacterized protein LOC142349837 n=1 Tax=Convolutriloba macropyga TaxID=536237 RepID=UPI003F5205D3